MNKALETAVKSVGGMRALGRILGISHQAIGCWKRIPAERVLEIEKATEVHRSILRPDIYPPKDYRR